MRDELSAVEAKLRSLPTRNESACVVNGHEDGLLGWEDDECVSGQSQRVSETKELRILGMKMVNRPY